MSSFPRAFSFESAYVLLANEIFRPLQDAVCRWVAHCPEAYEGLGTRFWILYEHADGRFVFLEYSCCQPRIERELDFDIKIWHSDSAPNGGVVDNDRALGFILKHRLAIPASLESALPQHLKHATLASPPRPITEWSGKGHLQRTAVTLAHDVAFGLLLDKLLDATIHFVQEIRSWSKGTGQTVDAATTFGAALFVRYPVDHRKWWGDINKVAPATVELVDLPFPESIVAIRDLIRDVQTVTEGPIVVLTCRGALGHVEAPSDLEKEEARQDLARQLPEIEQFVLAIRVAQDALAQPPAPAISPPPPNPKCPSSEEIQIYKLSISQPGTQEHIASLYEKLYGLPTTQGQVSRSIKKCRGWIAANQILPAAPLPDPKRVRSVDPADLDMGAPQEGRTPRQRRKSDSD